MNHKQLTNRSSVGKHPDRLSHPALSAGRLGHAAEPSDNPAGGFSRVLYKLLLPLAITALTGALFVTALSVVAYQSPDPTAWILPLSTAALALASLAGGLAAGKCYGERAVSGSLLSGCLFAGLLCLIALLHGNVVNGMPIAVSWLIRLGTVPVYLLGGILTRPKPKIATHTAGNHLSHRR